MPGLSLFQKIRSLITSEIRLAIVLLIVIPVVVVLSAWWMSGVWFANALDTVLDDGVKANRAKLKHMVQFVTGRFIPIGGIPQVLAVDAVFRTVAVSSEGDPFRARANILLDYLAQRLNVDVAWILNADGTCIVSSNYDRKESFVGVNYSDRKYYVDAKLGKPGRQYAVGRQTNIPGLYFSAPIIVDGVFVGAAVIKTNLPKLADQLLQPGTFIADSQGVVILTRDGALTLRTVPDAVVSFLSPEERRQQYMTDTLQPMPIASGGIADHPEIIYFGGSRVPAIMANMTMPSEGLALFAVTEMPQISTLQRDRRRLFGAAAVTGILLGWVVTGLLMWWKGAEDEIRHLAFYDPLTRLPNRRLLLDRLQQALASSTRSKREGALLFIDLDNFKTLNDTFGHAWAIVAAAGDPAPDRLHARGRHRGPPGRRRVRGHAGRPERKPEDAAAPDQSCRRKDPRQRSISLTPSPRTNTMARPASARPCSAITGQIVDDLLKQADFAMYQAKAAGRNTMRFFDPDMQAAVKARAALEERTAPGDRDKPISSLLPTAGGRRGPIDRRRSPAALAASRARLGASRPNSFRWPRKPG